MPTIIRWIGKVEPNSVNPKIFSSLDWFPTIGFLAGYSLNQSVVYDGIDVTAGLFTASPSPREAFFFHSVSDILCDEAIVVSSDKDPEIRNARGVTFDTTPYSSGSFNTSCNCTANARITSPVLPDILRNVSSAQECCQMCLNDNRCVASAWHSPGFKGGDTLTCYLHTGNELQTMNGVTSCATGRTPPPPPPPRLCMPLVMAVRKGKYKLHMFTKGGSRPPTGRGDWPPPSVKGLKYG